MDRMLVVVFDTEPAGGWPTLKLPQRGCPVLGRVSGRGGAAERLGLKRTTLQTKMRKLNIGRADYGC